MERFYRFADITFRIQGIDDQMFLEDGILTPFRVNGPDFDHSVFYAVVPSLPAVTGECVYRAPRIQVYRKGEEQIICMGDSVRLPNGAHTQIRRSGNNTSVMLLTNQVPERITHRLVLNTLEVEHHLVRRKGFLLHASFVCWNNRAILFTGPSGTGKSTQADLWRKYRSAEIINGDRVAVTVKAGKVMAHGIPYCGTSGICRNAEIPVEAIVYLTQAPQSEARSLFGLKAFQRLWEGCSLNLWNQDDVDLCCTTVMESLNHVKVVHLACTPNEHAVNVLETYLKVGT